MRSVEGEGGTIDEAIASALGALRVSREAVEIEILENATRGLFGLGSKPARIRATIRPSLSASIDTEIARGPAPVSRETSTLAGSQGLERAAAATKACEVLGEVLRHLVDSPIVEEMDGGDPRTLQLTIGARDSGIVIGRHGQTLDALEHLMNRIVLRDDADPGMRIALDVEGYRQRRQESLEELARRLASKAKATGRLVTLSPMSPRDRRIVHLALQSDPAVTTRSEGDGQYRRLVIVPQG